VSGEEKAQHPDDGVRLQPGELYIDGCYVGEFQSFTIQPKTSPDSDEPVVQQTKVSGSITVPTGRATIRTLLGVKPNAFWRFLDRVHCPGPIYYWLLDRFTHSRRVIASPGT
jgi:hypothetical protein